jgi:hypothetical protein
MSWLTKIFEDIQKGVQIFMGIEPVIAPALPSGTAQKVSDVADDFTLIAQAVTNAQAVVAAVTAPGATSASIVQAAAPLVATAISKSEVLLGSKIVNQAGYSTAVNTITTGMVELLSALGKV